MRNSTTSRFFDLVRSVTAGTTSRSENDLSRHLANTLEGLGLHTVLDSSIRSSAARKTRPDILAYTNSLDADLVAAADIVIESKLPSAYTGERLSNAMLGELWDTKTLPYIGANLSRIQYFVLTTFTDYVILRINSEIRECFRQLLRDQASQQSSNFRQLCRANTTLLSLENLEKPGWKNIAEYWETWLRNHFEPAALISPSLAEIRDSIVLRGAADLENLARQLAELTAGPEASDTSARFVGLFDSIRSQLSRSYNDLEPEIRRDLHLFVMSRNPASDLSTVELIIREAPSSWIDEFVAAGIHSLISRLFALDVIEDIYCLDAPNPLLERELWVFHVADYEGLGPEELRRFLFGRLEAIKRSKNLILRQLAFHGAFFDWIVPLLDPLLLRRLFLLIASCDFRDLQGDLLGRFFELYSQRINRSRRRALGQYFTPIAIVRLMWSLIDDALPLSGDHIKELAVLDPAMGAGTFLAQGASILSRRGASNFWERLVGFDVSPQSIGIAQVNVYMAALQELSEDTAQEIGELRLYTTDSLDPRNGKYMKQIAPLFSDPRHKEFIERTVEVSAEIKQDKRFLVIIGNPPYKNNSDLTLAQVAERFPRLLSSSAEASQAQVRNIRDDYAWFFAAADFYGDGEGTLLCFITSDSYTKKQSYRFFRQELIRHYSILKIIRLGPSIFADVSPRINFAIIMLARRGNPLISAHDAEPLEFVDMRSVYLGSSEGATLESRLRLLEDIANRTQALPVGRLHRPDAEHGFTLYPVEEQLVGRIMRGSAPVYAKEGPRLFLRKWPGLITAFDALFRNDSRELLARRMESFFTLCKSTKGEGKKDLRFAEWAATHGIYKTDEIERLEALANQVMTHDISYSISNIKRSFAGSIPNDLRWYPPPAFRSWIYYEHRLHIPRNVNPGKPQGWGSMEQWRTPESHEILPKLIFTSSANPGFGYKAFVVDDKWYVKLHGGTSQQYNYTGLNDPGRALSLRSNENNLDREGEAALVELASEGCTPDDLLHFIAGIYNSSLALDFLDEESGHDLQIRLPSQKSRSLAATIAKSSRRLRDLHRILYDSPLQGELPEETGLSLAPVELLSELGITRRTRKAKRFKSGDYFELPADLGKTVTEAIELEQATLDEQVDLFYS
jgi:hypothetical protein